MVAICWCPCASDRGIPRERGSLHCSPADRDAVLLMKALLRELLFRRDPWVVLRLLLVDVAIAARPSLSLAQPARF